MSLPPAKTGAKQAKGRFPKGVSGNPRGRPQGSRNAATIVAQMLLDGEVERLTRKVIELAVKGDTAALRICIDRILPPRRERPVKFVLPSMRSADDAAQALAAIATAVAAGDLLPTEAVEMSRLVDSYVRALEAADLERRLRKLEERGS